MVIKTGATDTSISYMCDWQYSQLPNNNNQVNDAAELFAIRFMILDKVVFGHTEFSITDPNLFRNDSKLSPKVTLGKKVATGNVQTNLAELVENCTDVTVSFSMCDYIATQGSCYGPGGSCDHCGSDRCPPSGTLTFTYCWQEWVDGGGGSGSGGSTGGSGGGGGGGGSIPPDPCQPTEGSIRTPQTQVNPGVKVNIVDNCNSDPGWTPTDQDQADMEWFNSTPAYNIDFNASVPPCITEIIKKVLSSENTIASFIKEKFSESAKFNVKFVIDNNINAAGRTVPTPYYEKRENGYGKFVKMDLTIKINTTYNGTKLSIAQTIIHELIHAYFMYRMVDANGNAAKEEQFERELGFLKPYDPNAPGSTFDPYGQHEQMANSYVNKIMKGLKAYQVISPSDLDSMKVVYPNITVDEYYEGMAWAGLTEDFSGNAITKAWKLLKDADPAKAAKYATIIAAEQYGTELSAGKTKCN